MSFSVNPKKTQTRICCTINRSIPAFKMSRPARSWMLKRTHGWHWLICFEFILLGLFKTFFKFFKNAKHDSGCGKAVFIFYAVVVILSFFALYKLNVKYTYNVLFVMFLESARKHAAVCLPARLCVIMQISLEYGFAHAQKFEKRWLWNCIETSGLSLFWVYGFSVAQHFDAFVLGLI